MFLTTHAAAGLAISRIVNDPLAVFSLSFASHFVLDFIPHGDEHLYGDYLQPSPHRFRRAVAVNAVDLIALIGLAVWAVRQPLSPSTQLMLIGILGSIVPDFLSHFFPLLHQRLSWLFLVRWIYAATKPTGLRYVVRGQDWLHRISHHRIIRTDVPLTVGVVMQIGLVAAFFALVRSSPP
ncbi:MAG: hypothetical protein HYY50_04665 [Candidatus Kerfeldbacteria bacterium]|nr:hypothetical protein [Candidatus Kerfeldbacteria bacterium]